MPFYIIWLSGVRGGLCNPSYWEDGFWGWPEDREPVWGWKQPSEGPHYTWEQLECHGCSQGRGGPGFSGGRRKSNLLSSAQSVVFNYSCYCGVRIWTGLGGRNVCSVPRFCLEGGVTNASPGREAKSLKTGYPLTLLQEGFQSNEQMLIKAFLSTSWNLALMSCKIKNTHYIILHYMML